MFHELHRSIEEAAVSAARNIISDAVEFTYPPNHGLSPEETAALQSIPKTAAMEGALRKLIADASAWPIFHLMSLADGVVDPELIKEVHADDEATDGLMLHDAFYESYWTWRRRRVDPGWRLDTYSSD